MPPRSSVRIASSRVLSRIGALLFAAALLGVPDSALAQAASQPAPAKADGPKYEQTEAKVVKQDDGTLLVDDKYIVKGEGTKEKPYIITWDMLVSVHEEFDPRAKKVTLPGRVMMLAEKQVIIEGYVCFPLAIEQPRELLSMLNQWDGCCIGVPPTPYDAVEVRLGQPVVDDGRFATTGSVQGTFKVEPYLVGEWLVGLYLMEDARFMPKVLGGLGS
jgi:hypothetical protein